ncbi:NADPH-dependent FMN reductase [Pseudomarimonas arenosa]|uniref:NAD(P)H-dependent oxidoreductase n=1 Tax=Pseudomarimonas arenosa TaxID=2774145 RepID=A0AAW3ZLU5_9GAMM|nr:NAD(P)H-dependent oxidoreductase [Pseudomarimonas arenosa]MBD8526718.1 NAD(P)H-dependent oxidoreductase [Pseudomarimonas arenosa]
MSLKLVMFYGSARSSRQGIKAARFIKRQCEARGHQVSLIEPLSHPLPLLDKMYKEYAEGEAPSVLQQMAEAISAADAFVVVSGEYNHTVPPGLSNLMDHFLEQYYFKPSAIVSYSAGPFGGVRAAMTLRAMLGELGTPSIPSTLPISQVHKAFSDEGDALDTAYEKRADKFLTELEWYAHALKRAREHGCKRAACESSEAGVGKS